MSERPSVTTPAPAVDLNADAFRQLVAARIGCDPCELTDDAEPIVLGIDSLAIMSIAGQCTRSGVAVGFAELAERRTFGEWLGLVYARTTNPGPTAPAPAVPTGTDSVDESAPFDLALMQHAYWVGRLEDQELGGVATHLYTEFDGRAIDPERLDAAARALLDRHAMLRVRILDDGRQQILSDNPWPGLTVHDLRDLDQAEVACHVAERRDLLSHRTMDVAAGQVFDLELSLLPDGLGRVHVDPDMLAADAVSFRTLMADLAALYERPEASLPALAYSYPRYLADRRATAAQRSAERDRARAWWHDRLADLPGPPQLPRADGPATRPRVSRRHHRLDPECTAALAARAHRHGVTPAMALATAYAEILGMWSAEPRFLLNLPLFDRDEQLHPDVPSLVGDFSSSVLLAVDTSAPAPFAQRALDLQRELHAAVAHGAHPGVEVLRDLTRAADGEPVLAPVVYTSALS